MCIYGYSVLNLTRTYVDGKHSQMDNNIQKGQLKRWDDAKAFGFIKPEVGKKDVFIHISALKGMSRRPIVGDTIFFQYPN